MGLKTIFFFLISIAFAVSGYGQCNSSYTLDSKVPITGDQGVITLQVQSSGPFECRLLVFRNGVYDQLEKVSGKNNEKVIFNQLDKKALYKVEVIFQDEKELCRVRQTGGIKF